MHEEMVTMTSSVDNFHPFSYNEAQQRWDFIVSEILSHYYNQPSTEKQESQVRAWPVFELWSCVPRMNF